METSIRTCIRCGKAIASDRKIAKYCPECASEIRREAIRRPRGKQCIDCGTDFMARGTRSMRCPACQSAYGALNNLERTLAYQHGQSRKLGKEYPCAQCGELFVLMARTQRYCAKCAGKNHGRERVVASKTCPRCGAVIDATRALCAKCAHADLLTEPRHVVNVSNNVTRAPVVCATCGAEIMLARRGKLPKYCPECRKKRQTALQIACHQRRRAQLAQEKVDSKERPNEIQ